jgi:hypothetical protein
MYLPSSKNKPTAQSSDHIDLMKIKKNLKSAKIYNNVHISKGSESINVSSSSKNQLITQPR